MKVINLIILVLALSGSEGRYKIIEKIYGGDESTKLMDEAVTTLLSCYENEVNTIGAVDISEPGLLKLLFSKQSLPIVLIENNETRKTVENRSNKGYSQKLGLFVVEGSSTGQLNKTLARTVSSQLSNDARYLIIDWGSQKSQKGCLKAFVDLWAAWEVQILNVHYVCFDKLEEEVKVYSFNPYTSKAPAPWRLNKTYTGINDHPWSMIVREYQPKTRDICRNLNFDKDHDMGGYHIKAFLQTTMPRSNWTQRSVQWVFETYTTHQRCIFDALKATPDLYVFNPARSIDESWAWNPRKNITTNKFLDDYEIVLNYVNNLEMIGRPASSRIRSGGISVLTQHTGELSQLAKLAGVLDKRTRLGLCGVVFTTLLFFKYCMRQSFGSAILNVFRIVSNSSIEKEPKRSALRLYLAGVFILVVTIVGIYQGLIAALLTKSTPLPNINTWDDLADSLHKIHGPGRYAKYFDDPKFNGRFIKHIDPYCVNFTIRNPLAACVGDPVNLVHSAIDFNLHVSKDIIVPAYYVVMIRKNTHFEKRLNEVIGLLTASHVDWYWKERVMEERLRKAEYLAYIERNTPSVMKLHQLGFAFAFLGIGLLLATVAFIGEVITERFSSTVSAAKSRVRNGKRRRRNAVILVREKQEPSQGEQRELKASVSKADCEN